MEFVLAAGTPDGPYTAGYTVTTFDREMNADTRKRMAECIRRDLHDMVERFDVEMLVERFF